MPPQKQSTWQKTVNYIKDVREVLYILTIAISIGGWIVTSRIDKNNFKNEVNNFKSELNGFKTTIENNTKQLEKINDILMDQKELNGKIIQYMEK